jgi:hypothetical protein
MNDERDFEQRVVSVFDGTAPSRGPDDLLEEVFSVTGSTRPRPRWLVRLTEKPMRYDSVLVSGSPTARTAMLLAATMLLVLALAGVAIAGAQLLGRGETYVVTADGSGDFTTITEALAAAVDGDTVLVRPGTYQEDLVIRHDITVRGDGPRDEVVIDAPGAGLRTIVGRGTPGETGLPVGVDLQLSNATLEGLALRGDRPLVAIRVIGGAPTLRDLEVAIDDPDGVSPSMLLVGGSATSLADVRLDGRVVVTEASSMTLADSELSAPVEASGPGWMTITGNRFLSGSGLVATDGARGQVSGNAFEASAIIIESASELAVHENSLRDVTGTALTVSHDGTNADIRGNVIRGSSTGVAIGPQTVVSLIDNTICGNETDIFESSSAEAEIHDNDIGATCPDSPEDGGDR